MELYTKPAARFLISKQQLKRMIEYAFRRKYVGYIRAISHELVVNESEIIVNANVSIYRLGTYGIPRNLITANKLKVKLGIKIKKNPFKIRKS